MVGEFICVTGFNVNDPSKVTFTSEPDINFTPTFFKDEKTSTVMALVPFNWNLPVGDYALTFAYGGTTEVINVTVIERENEIKLDEWDVLTFCSYPRTGIGTSKLFADTYKDKLSNGFWYNNGTILFLMIIEL